MTPQDLLKLLHGKFSSLTIAFNDEHAINYATAQEWHDKWHGYSGDSDDVISWPTDEERLKAIRENSVWTIQWYPRTPVGFCCVGAPTFEAAARYAIELSSETT